MAVIFQDSARSCKKVLLESFTAFLPKMAKILQDQTLQGLARIVRCFLARNCLLSSRCSVIKRLGTRLPRFCKILQESCGAFLQEIGCRLPRFCKILQESLARILRCFLARHKLSTSKILQDLARFLRCFLARNWLSSSKLLQDLTRKSC